MNLLIKESDFEFLSSQYESIQFHMLNSDDHLSFISCIVCVCETSNDIVENWRAIQNLLAINHQISGKFDAWNMYLAFVSVENVPINEKYEIENNKFSTRKIVLDGFKEAKNIGQLIIELENQLLGSDLSLESRESPQEEYSSSLKDYYSGAPFDSKHESKEKRASMIDKIIESLNNNEN